MLKFIRPSASNRNPRPEQVAVVMVDVQLSHRKNENICSVLSAAGSVGAKRILLRYDVEGRETEPIAREIVEAAGKDALIIPKYQSNAFPELGRILKKMGTTTVIFGGYHKYECAYDNAVGAVSKGFAAITSPDLLIGKDYTTRHFRIDMFYRTGIKMYGNSKELVSDISSSKLDATIPKNQFEKMKKIIWECAVAIVENPGKTELKMPKALIMLEILAREHPIEAHELAIVLKRALSMTPPSPNTAHIRAAAEKPLNAMIYKGSGEIKDDTDLGWVH